MKKVETEIAFQDERGSICDLIDDDEINAITRISFTSNAVRANHYHKKTIQWNYVISGNIKLVTQMPDEEVKEVIMNPGDLYLTEPNESHALQCVSDQAELLVFTKGPRAGKDYENDTYRLEKPLIQ